MNVAGRSDVVVVGSGIVGVALAAAHARRGRSVILLEREDRPVGASVRNFGLVWAVGQPPGSLWNRALASRSTWLTYAKEAGFHANPVGSLHLARSESEVRVIREFLGTAAPDTFEGGWLEPCEVAARSPAARLDGLWGALWSPHEVTVDGREALPAIIRWLVRDHGVRVVTDAAVSCIEHPRVVSAAGLWEGRRTYVCTGPEIRILYPDLHREAGVTNCKLQMMRTAPQPGGWKLGPTLCGGLTLIHYPAFSKCPGLPALRAELEARFAGQLAHGIHVLVSQNAAGELLIGDTHHYGLTHDPFLVDELDQMILKILHEFAILPDMRPAQRWCGVYPRISGAAELISSPEPGVTVVNALGGAGMTLAFGTAEELAEADI
jgi:D-hydroxyproline dehydrogenase subunit beta